MTTTPENKRWSRAEEQLDLVQADLQRLDALESAGLQAPNSDNERRRLEGRHARAEREVHDAEVAFYRAEGDDERADELESDRMHRDLEATNAAADVLRDLRGEEGS